MSKRDVRRPELVDTQLHHGTQVRGVAGCQAAAGRWYRPRQQNFHRFLSRQAMFCFLFASLGSGIAPPTSRKNGNKIKPDQ